MAAPDFFENFLLHDGLKTLRPQENPLIVPLSRQRRYRQADTLHEGPNPHVGPWWASPKPAGGGVAAPPPLSALTMPEKSAQSPETARSMRRIFARYSLSFSLFLTKIRLFRVLSALFHPLQCFM